MISRLTGEKIFARHIARQRSTIQIYQQLNGRKIANQLSNWQRISNWQSAALKRRNKVTKKMPEKMLNVMSSQGKADQTTMSYHQLLSE